jgi:hypothetical protein
MKVNFNEITNYLKLWKYSFSLQRSVDRFIIWKHGIKWKRYAEILIEEKTAYINGFGKSKKRRKVDILFNIIDNFRGMFKMKVGRIYNIFNRENLELLVRKAVKKMTRMFIVIRRKKWNFI